VPDTNPADILVSVLHPTIRPVTALGVKNEWVGRASRPELVEWIFAVREDVQMESAVVVPKNQDGLSTYTSGTNLAALHSHGDILFVMADDFHGPKGWDTWIRESLAPYLNQSRLLTLIDHPSRQKSFDLCCFPVLTRRMYELNGWVYYPGYRHLYGDEELSVRTRKAGERVDAPQPSGFLHDHPLLNSAKWDEVYRQANSPKEYEHGKKLFLERNPS
jgi:hypothetical protein